MPTNNLVFSSIPVVPNLQLLHQACTLIKRHRASKSIRINQNQSDCWVIPSEYHATFGNTCLHPKQHSHIFCR